MSKFWVPPKVAAELVEERRQFTAMLDEVAVRDKMLHVKGLLDEATYRARQLDERLEVVRAPDTVPVHSTLKPGYYAVIRWNEGAPPLVMNIQGPNGEFVDLDGNLDAVMAMLHRNNLKDPEVRRRIERAEQDLDRSVEREKERDNEERREELRDRISAISRTSVSMNRDTPWAQNAAGFRRSRGTRKWRAGDIGKDRWR